MKKKSTSKKEPTWEQIGREIGIKMEKLKNEECNPWKYRIKEHVYRHNHGGGIYGLGFIGALVYYLSTATSFWMGVLGILKAIVWPAFFVYGIFQFLGM